MAQLNKDQSELCKIVDRYFNAMNLSNAVENLTNLLGHFIELDHLLKDKEKDDPGFTLTYIQDTTLRTTETIQLLIKLYENSIKNKAKGSEVDHE